MRMYNNNNYYHQYIQGVQKVLEPLNIPKNKHFWKKCFIQSLVEFLSGIDNIR